MNRFAGRSDALRRPPSTMIGVNDEYRDLYGVEPICDHLQIAASTEHEHTRRWIEPARRLGPVGLRNDTRDSLRTTVTACAVSMTLIELH